MKQGKYQLGASNYIALKPGENGVIRNVVIRKDGLSVITEAGEFLLTSLMDSTEKELEKLSKQSDHLPPEYRSIFKDFPLSELKEIQELETQYRKS